jgi:hypothetical protein
VIDVFNATQTQEFHMSVLIRNLAGVVVVTFALGQSFVASADPVAEDLQNCAVAALAERQQSAKTITVKTGGLSRAELDRDRSAKRNRYLMSLIDKSSGERLGLVTCRVGQDGELIAASFKG